MNEQVTIFLDLDGVLITQWSELQPRKKWFKEFAKPFQPEGVKIINKIIEERETKIVLSSDWRYMFNEQMLADFFKYNNINQKPIPMPYDYRHEFTKKEGLLNYKELRRCKEIETYVNEYKVKEFIIFDDLELICFPNNFIKTEFPDGLTDIYRERIEKILKLRDLNK